jgi:alpha-ribazole phosphatase
MSTIYLVRHGEVAGNVGRLFFAGWDDVPLNARGEQQAQAVAKYLRGANLKAVYSSDLQRARRTAEEIAAPHNVQVLEDAAWREIHFGDWAGAGEAELLEKWPELWRERQADPENVRPPNGESLRDLWKRVQPAWESVVSRHRREGSGDAAVVAHQGTIRVLLLGLLGAPLGSYRTLIVRNCSVSTVALAGGKVSITGFGLSAHLDD